MKMASYDLRRSVSVFPNFDQIVSRKINKNVREKLAKISEVNVTVKSEKWLRKWLWKKRENDE